jgi:DnaJ family protein B protein 12
METGGLGIHYYVNPTEFSNHPVIGAELAKEGVKLGRVVEEQVVETPDSVKDGDKGKDTQSKGKVKLGKWYEAKERSEDLRFRNLRTR